MYKRLRALLIVIAVIGGIAVATRAEANHGSRTLQVHPEVSSTTASVDASGTGGTGQRLQAELSSPADTDIRIAFEVESGPANKDGNTPESPDYYCTIEGPGGPVTTTTVAGATTTTAAPTTTSTTAAGATTTTAPAETTSTCYTVPIIGVGTGQSIVRAWIDHDNKDEDDGGTTEADRQEARLSQPVTPPVIGSSGDCEPEDGPEADCEAGTALPGTVTEPDMTDVVQINYVSGPSKLDCDDSTNDDTETNNVADPETYTCTVTDAFGAELSNVRIDAENLDGANDPDNSATAGTTDYNPSPGSGSGSFCTTGAEGTCSGAIPAHEGQTGSAAICFFVDQAGTTDNQTFDPAGSVNDGGDCDVESVGETENNDVTDTVSLTWNTSTPASTTTTTAAPTTTTTAAPTTTTTASTTTTTTASTTTTTTGSTTTTTTGSTTTTTAAATTTTTIPPAPGDPFNQFAAYPGFNGGMDIAVGNLDDDAQDEIVTAAGPGGGPHVKVFNVNPDRTVTQSNVQFMAYATNFTGGVRVAIGDVNGDGLNDIITGTGQGGGPHVKIFNRDGSLQSPGFMAYAPAFTGGVDVAVGNVDGDAVSEIVTGAGPGGGPHVRMFNGDGTLQSNGFMAYGTFNGGVNVAVSDVDNNQSASEIVTGPGSGGGPHVKVLNLNGTVRNEWNAYGAAFSGGVNVSTGNVLGTPTSAREVITGPGPGGGPHVVIFSPTGATLEGYMAFTNFAGGVVTGAGDVATVANEVSGGEVVTGAFRASNQVAGRRFNK